MELVGKQIGNYVVRKQLGSGGMGTVFLCEHPLLGRKVALKVLHEQHARDADLVERFFTEARAANDIRHDHIVEVHDFGWIPGPDGQPAVPYLMMECLDGQDLAALVPSMTIEQSLHVILQCCEALQASHDKGIVHRDLKPENIFLVRHGDDPLFVKIVDFGIAKLLAPGEGGRTALGTVLGTPSYMSPEQCEGLGHVDHRADIYSLGVVLYELLAKRLPFPGVNFAEVVVGHMSKAPIPPSQINPQVSRAIEAIVLHAMEKDPGHRFQSMNELAAAIHDPDTHLLAYRNLRGDQPTMQAARSGNTLIVGGTTTPIPDAPTLVPTPVPTPVPQGGMPGPWPALGPDTLPPLAGQVGPPAHRGHPLALLGAAAAVVAAVVAGAILAGPDRPPGPGPVPVPVVVAEPPPARVEPAVPDAAPKIEHVTITLQTEPPGADVFRLDQAEARAGTTPLELRVEKGAPPIPVRIVLNGYIEQRRSLTTDAGREIVLVLVRAPAPAPEPKPVSEPKPTPRPRHPKPEL